MDVVKSDEQEMSEENHNSRSDSDSIPDHIIITDSPMSTTISTSGIDRDPNTGCFTASSFANFPDEWLE